MRRIREVLRLRAELGANLSAIAAGAKLARSTVRTYLDRAAAECGVPAAVIVQLARDFAAAPREPTSPAPRLGEHTDQVLAEVLGLPDGEIARLHDGKIVAGPNGN